MPIVNGELYLNLTDAQIEELFFNLNYRSISFKDLQPTTAYLFNTQTVAASASIQNDIGLPTGNNAKMQASFSNTGESTDCTMILYGSDLEDGSIPGELAVVNLSANSSCRSFIDTMAIPEYTFAKIINNDSLRPAVGTIRITTWKEQDTAGV